MVKLQFEKWLEDARLGEDVGQIFTDAVKCYKAGVYRAALLFSYLGFSTALRERLLRAERPAAFTEEDWRKMRGKVQNEDVWEKAVFDATQQQQPAPFFSISSDLREQIKFWRNRRNDCAHFKSSEIGGAHVEAFWSLVQSDLAKITVEGGIQTLLAKMEEHYTIYKVSSNTDVMPLVAQIESSIDVVDLPAFWHQALMLANPNYQFWLVKSGLDFITKVLELRSPRLTRSLMQFIKSSTGLLLDYLGHDPNFVSQLDFTPVEARTLWYKHLAGDHRGLRIYGAMLAAGLIPSIEIAEANRRLLERQKDYDVSPITHYILQANGFGQAIVDMAFASDALNKFTWSQERYSLLTGYIENYPLTPLVVRRLCDVFDKDSAPYFFKDSLNRLFNVNSIKRAEFLVVMTEEGRSIPRHLSSLGESPQQESKESLGV